LWCLAHFLEVLEAHFLQVLEVQVFFAQAEQVGDVEAEHVVGDVEAEHVVDVEADFAFSGHVAAADAAVIARTKKTNIKILAALTIVFCIIFSSFFWYSIRSEDTQIENTRKDREYSQ
jgi:hypothetical protein